MKKFFKKLKKHSTKDHAEKKALKEPTDSKQPDEEIEKDSAKIENKPEEKDISQGEENSMPAESETETSFTELADQSEKKTEQSETKEELSEKDDTETPKDEPKTEQKSFLEGHRFDLEEIEKNTSLWVREVSQKTFYLTHLILLTAGLVLIGLLGYYLHSDRTLYDLHTSAPITKQPTSFRLNLNSPEDDLLTYEKSIIISGETSPNSTLIIANNDQTTALEANSKGDFSKVMVLDPGVNAFVISAIDKSGTIKTIERSIYFTEEELSE